MPFAFTHARDELDQRIIITAVGHTVATRLHAGVAANGGRGAHSATCVASSIDR